MELTARGEAVNPVLSLTEWVDDEADLYSVNVLKANRDRMGYARRNGANVVSILIHEGGVKTLYLTALGLAVGLVAQSSVFAAIGVPPEAVILFLCVEPICDMVDTVANVGCNVASALLLAKKFDMWDEERYRKESF